MNKIRQRYIIFEVLAPNGTTFSDKVMIRTIWQKLLEIFGEQTSFKAGLWLIEWDPVLMKGILRTDHLIDSEIIATLAIIRKITKIPVIVHTRKSTGTIKKAKSICKDIFQISFPNKNPKN